MKNYDSIYGCLLGAGIGDALGLSFEGLKKHRLKKIYKKSGKYHLFFGKGMFSDDTEHICMVANALIKSVGDEERFGKHLANSFRVWFLTLPVATGFGTLRALLKLIVGFSYKQSGIFTAGNGPSMRSSIIGVCYGDDMELMKKLVRISTRITHKDPKAEYGALAVALAAHMASESKKKILPADFYKRFKKLINIDDANEFVQLLDDVCMSIKKGESTEQYAVLINQAKGISGYTYHTVPVVIHCWLRNQEDFMTGLDELLRCGGDTDTTCSILGGILGAQVGAEKIPADLKSKIIDWPLSIRYIEKLSQRLSQVLEQKESGKPLRLVYPCKLCRNFFFLIIVLFHGFRRLLPPY